jgi:hypothetical protein
MIAQSTARALNLRALGTAGWLETWIDQLLGEMEKQNIKMAVPAKDDGDEMFTLKRRDVRKMINQMTSQKDQLQRFAKRPKVREL